MRESYKKRAFFSRVSRVNILFEELWHSNMAICWKYCVMSPTLSPKSEAFALSIEVIRQQVVRCTFELVRKGIFLGSPSLNHMTL